MRIQSWRDLVAFIKADAASKGVPSLVDGILRDPVFRFTVHLRVNEWLANRGTAAPLQVLPRLTFRRLSIRLGFSVPLNVFGPGLAIVHYGLLVVTPTAKVGKNCRVHAGVNIGGAGGFSDASTQTSSGPVIGDNCYIGPGAKIYGPIRIGQSCVVGANAVVNKSFDQDAVTIAGIPAKVVRERGSDGLILRGA